MADELLLRQTPHSVEAEQAVLGSILLDPACTASVMEALSENDFYIETNKIIFRTIAHMFTNGKTVDPVTVLEEMKALGHKEQANRDYFLAPVKFIHLV